MQESIVVNPRRLGAAGWVPVAKILWDELISWPVDEVRTKLGISPPCDDLPVAKGAGHGEWSPPGPRDLLGSAVSDWPLA